MFDIVKAGIDAAKIDADVALELSGPVERLANDLEVMMPGRRC